MVEHQQQQQRQKEEKDSESKKVIDFSKSKEEQQKEKIKEDTDFPPFETQKVTVRREYKNDRFGNSYGPYIYCYWKDKQTHKLKKYYVGKSVEDHDSRAAYEGLNVMFGLNVTSGLPRRPSEWRKWEFLMSQRYEKQNKLAEFYLKKVEDNEVTIDWAYRLVKWSIHEIRKKTLLAMAAKGNITHNTVKNQYFGAAAPTTDNDVITHFLCYQKHIYRNKQLDEYLESDEVKQEYATQTWSLWNKYTHAIKIEDGV